MTADQRLDQLEPLVAQTLAVADRHTAQLKQITSVVIQQSDNITFVLHELASLKQDVGTIKQKQDATDARIQALDSKVEGIDSKLDRLIDLLGNSK